MTQNEALELIERESGESGLHVAARMGEDLDPARVARLVSAIRTLTESLRRFTFLASKCFAKRRVGHLTAIKSFRRQYLIRSLILRAQSRTFSLTLLDDDTA